MCIALPDGEPLTADEIANMWKEVTANSPEVEQHRLKCTMPANVTTAIINNSDISTGSLSRFMTFFIVNNWNNFYRR